MRQSVRVADQVPSTATCDLLSAKRQQIDVLQERSRHPSKRRGAGREFFDHHVLPITASWGALLASQGMLSVKPVPSFHYEQLRQEINSWPWPSLDHLSPGLLARMQMPSTAPHTPENNASRPPLSIVMESCATPLPILPR